MNQRKPLVDDLYKESIANSQKSHPVDSHQITEGDGKNSQMYQSSPGKLEAEFTHGTNSRLQKITSL